MEWYEADVRAMEAARRLRRQSDNAPVFYGSSTIRLWNNLPEDLGCPEALNLGFGGSTLEACVYFFDRLIVPERPKSLILYAGDNDIGDGRLPHQVFKFFKDFKAKLSTLPLTSFCFLSIKPSPSRFALIDRIRETNRLIQQDIASSERCHFIDLFPEMLQADGKPKSELFENDGLHMNESGYKLWSKLLLPHRHEMFMGTSYAVQSSSLGSLQA